RLPMHPTAGSRRTVAASSEWQSGQSAALRTRFSRSSLRVDTLSSSSMMRTTVAGLRKTPGEHRWRAMASGLTPEGFSAPRLLMPLRIARRKPEVHPSVIRTRRRAYAAPVWVVLFPLFFVLDMPSMMLLNRLRLPRWMFAYLVLRALDALR